MIFKWLKNFFTKRQKEHFSSPFKPCPFCGSEHVDFLIRPPRSQYEREKAVRYFSVMCVECHAQTDDTFTVQDKAKKAWNRRVEND